MSANKAGRPIVCVSLSQEATSDSVRSPIAQPPSLDVRLKTPVYLRRPPTSEVIQKDPGPERKLPRAVLSAWPVASLP